MIRLVVLAAVALLVGACLEAERIAVRVLREVA